MPFPLPAPLKDPSTLFYQSNVVKRSIIASYWTVILLAVPLWWYATSIQRLSLPISQIHSHAQRHLKLPVDICVEDVDAVSNLHAFFAEKTRAGSDGWSDLEVRVHGGSECADTSSYRVRNAPNILVTQNEIYLPLHDKQRLSSASEIFTSLVNPSSRTINQNNRVVQYSPQYRLAFTLLNEDASTGSSASNWDIQAGLAQRVKPILDKLQPLHNFTIESQVQYHGRLAFKPQAIGDVSYGLTAEDLTVFINSAEWSLSSSASNDPVLHFVLFIPSATRRPLHILTSDAQISRSKSFLLPQWGGITIYNPPIDILGKNADLPARVNDQVFQEFSRQLLTLLGVPFLPNGVQTHQSDISSLSDWQIDALMRRRALENAKGAHETLTSIVKLVDQIENMPVKEDVKGDVQGALDALEKVSPSLHSLPFRLLTNDPQTFAASSLQDTFRYSAEATTLASRAFFNPGMLALLYFPAEHKYAVYTPLFASAVIPLFVAALKEITAWRKQR
ncbi:hypothetical protein P691DRAFT_763033 [Macrolepiota fuliginosa MF-IS2]|uniref:GPI transamidase component PIG-S n=1 Tax=Macrolepiota fuliginosa MF-IS2 TaxID=1400762 RepID=A0A9P6C0Y1_9AGAR|nr:hypothetical protein P691DRAFT_763033 [Macrolepiota fuliginosa MF-IS2]